MKGLAAGVAVRPLGDADHGKIVDPQVGQRRQRAAQLAAAAVDQHQIGPDARFARRILPDRPAEAAGQHLAHHGVVVARRQARRADVEFPVGGLDQPVRAGRDHAADGVGAGDVAVGRRPRSAPAARPGRRRRPPRRAAGAGRRFPDSRRVSAAFALVSACSISLRLSPAPGHGELDLPPGSGAQRRGEQRLVGDRPAGQDQAGGGGLLS